MVDGRGAAGHRAFAREGAVGLTELAEQVEEIIRDAFAQGVVVNRPKRAPDIRRGFRPCAVSRSDIFRLVPGFLVTMAGCAAGIVTSGITQPLVPSAQSQRFTRPSAYNNGLMGPTGMMMARNYIPRLRGVNCVGAPFAINWKPKAHCFVPAH